MEHEFIKYEKEGLWSDNATDRDVEKGNERARKLSEEIKKLEEKIAIKTFEENDLREKMKHGDPDYLEHGPELDRLEIEVKNLKVELAGKKKFAREN